MKIKIKAEMEDSQGKIIVKEVEAEVPEYAEFGDPNQFHKVFAEFEKPVIEARNQIGEKIAESFLEEAVKASKKGANFANAKLKEKSEDCQ